MTTKAKIELFSIQNKTTLDTSLRNYKGYVMPCEFKNYLDDIEQFEVREDDVWLTGFPKTGTTWLQEMVWLIENNLDYEGAKMDLNYRFPYLEFTPIIQYRLRSVPDEVCGSIPNSVRELANMEERRFIKTHLPWELLPLQIQNGSVKPKIIHIIRNPKDVCVSYHHHGKLFPGYRNTLEQDVNAFLSDTMPYTPFWSNILSYWTKQSHTNLLVMTYEQMKKNLPASIRKVANFLGKDLNTEQVAGLQRHLCFENMQRNKAVNFQPMIEAFKNMKLYKECPGSFMRKGIVGSHKDELSQDIIKIMNTWIAQNTLNTNLKFDEFFVNVTQRR
ncbi:luciferin sulfotransferase-like [Onthophagus taurus]|uniref:luciferin sulfotransferase-like n=1 Tax=Onthophagus taurus TaxID=166361 RepID=UPI0039BDDC8C